MSILLELFNRTVPWETTMDEHDTFSAQFDIDQLTYEVNLDGKWATDIELYNPDELFDDVWEIYFNMSGTADADYYGSDGVTGTGNAILVFATVLEIIAHAVESKNIQTVSFGANDNQPTRVKLYNRMAAHFAKNGWRYIDDKEVRERSSEAWRLQIRGVKSYLLTKHPKPEQ